MTAEYDKHYDDLCPDKRHEAFGRGAQQIAEIASWSNKQRQSIKYPSKVKRELEQLRRSFRNLSLETQSSLWVMGTDGSSYSPSSDMIGRINLALSSIPTGRSEFDEVRNYLGKHAAALWSSHGGDIKAEEFENFLETLIDGAGFSGEGKVRIDHVALAKQLRKEYANCVPPHWDPYENFLSPTSR